MKTVIFSALSEPNRLHIVELLRSGPLTVGEIAAQLELRQPQASKHLRVLLEAGLVEVEAVANRRNYRLRPEPFQVLDSWLEGYLKVWNERYDQLELYLQKLQAGGNQAQDEKSERINPTPKEEKQ
ncbi:ArsR/SmtB family transcription factor [Paenibacillus sp. sgz500958]|uniref:ArsR/SmtB family transcription factor n=1 Tax=Paenibacillus sp. sgz500958 TaxID=3242475 RepID=UPI0036D3081C